MEAESVNLSAGCMWGGERGSGEKGKGVKNNVIQTKPKM